MENNQTIDLTINTDLARQILTGFIRTEITRAGFSRAVINLSGGIDSALSCFLAAEALGPENVLAVRMPYRTSSADSLRTCPGCDRCHRRAVADRRDHRHGRPADQPLPRYGRRAQGQHHGPPAHDRAVRPVGGLQRAGGRHRQQDRDPAGLHHALRRFGLRRSTRSATCTKPRCASFPGRWAYPKRSSPSRPRPTCGPGRPTKASWALPTQRWTSCSTCWWTSATARRNASRPVSTKLS